MYELYEPNLTLLIALSYMVRVCQGQFEGLYLMYLQNMRISSFLSLMANRKFISECYSQCRQHLGICKDLLHALTPLTKTKSIHSTPSLAKVIGISADNDRQTRWIYV